MGKHITKARSAAIFLRKVIIVQKVSDNERSEYALFAQGEYRAKG
ncbi:hypothetical protein N479_19565 [Pseudoalteromonas luteoviolacea S4054]|uniref:Uncharacterized protein n=1 Tax=Pseudoalteromonas luteoviolacea S4054 TaxID=1129367 RepID=A0A0F6A8C9_9GAMM|nr:hypothetical protein N479_19565 [Pseudoalteromonas luteoviolacea S4054]